MKAEISVVGTKTQENGSECTHPLPSSMSSQALVPLHHHLVPLVKAIPRRLRENIVQTLRKKKNGMSKSVCTNHAPSPGFARVATRCTTYPSHRTSPSKELEIIPLPPEFLRSLRCYSPKGITASHGSGIVGGLLDCSSWSVAVAVVVES